MVRLFHGSTPASFVGVLHKDSPGLTHMQSLLDIGLVPYCGELNNMGIAPGGISYLGISAVHHGRLFRALEYAERGLRSSWDPQVEVLPCEALKKEGVDVRNKKAVDNFLGQLAYFYGPKYNRWIPAKAI